MTSVITDDILGQALSGFIADLDALTSAATKANETGQPARDMASALQSTLDAYALQTSPTAQVKALVKQLTSDLDALKVLGQVDRTEGDQLAARITGATMLADSLAEDLKTKASASISAWQASAPKAAKGTRGPRAEKGSGVPIQMVCSCGWTNVDRSNPNSARWSYLGHLANAKKGHGFTSRPEDGSAPYKAATDAIYATAKDQGEHTSDAFGAPDGKSYRLTTRIVPGESAPAAEVPAAA